MLALERLLTRRDRKVLYYLMCDRCSHKFASVNKDKPCSLCLGSAHPYGFKEIHQGSPDAPEEPGVSDGAES